MKAKSKLFIVQGVDRNDPPARLIRAQTQHQVEKFLEGEAVKALWTGTSVKVASMDEAIELTGAGVKPEEIPEAAP